MSDVSGNRKKSNPSSGALSGRLAARQYALKLHLLTDADSDIFAANTLEDILHIALERAQVLTGAQSGQCRLELEESEQAIVLSSDTSVASEIPISEKERPQTTSLTRPIPARSGVRAGWIQISNPRGERFTQDDGATLLHLTRTVSLAIENRFRFETQNRRIGQKIEEWERLEALRLQAQKLEGIGRLAEEVAHDFNNLLTSISGFAELAVKKLPPETRSGKYLLNVCQTTARAQVLTHQLLAFARKEPISPQIIPLATLLTDVGGMLQRFLGDQIELVMETEPGLGLVNVDVGQFEQIIVTMALNAREAMAQGGRLTIRASNTLVLENSLQPNLSSESAQKEYVCLTISDTGMGMTKAIRERLFEPYFSTKAKGHGTGLGLATCYGLIQHSGGHIRVESEPGQGTTFEIYLPRFYESGSSLNSIEQKGSAMEHATGTETILLVEDEPLVRNFTAVALRSLGYTVLEVAAGGQALLTAQEYSGDIHLLVTDVILPHMSGPELAERLRALRPALRVLFASGHSSYILEQNGLSESNPSLLFKPFTINALGSKVRERLDTPSENE